MSGTMGKKRVTTGLPAYICAARGVTTSSKKKDYVPKASLRWAAFFGDAEHEVRKVTSGHRITLTYVLHRDTAPNPLTDHLLLRASSLQRVLERALNFPGFMPGGGTLGYQCKHLYEESQLKHTEAMVQKAREESAKVATAASSSSSSSSTKKKSKAKDKTLLYASKLKLKNEDAVLAVCLSSVGLRVQCLRQLEDGQGYMDEGSYSLDKMPSKRDAKRFGCMRNCDGWRQMAITPDEVAGFANNRTVTDAFGDIEFLGSHKGARHLFAERQFGEYFGNEASENEFYTSASLVVTVPEWNSTTQRREGMVAASMMPPRHLAAAQLHPKKPTKKRAAKEQPSSEAADPGDADGPAAKRQKTTSSSSSSSSSSAAPPSLFAAAAPKKKNAKKEMMNTIRTINVKNGRGSTKCDRLGGECQIVLGPGQGLRELKKSIRTKFGKVRKQRLGGLHLVNAATGITSSSAAKSTDLTNEVTVSCTYVTATGNGNLGGFAGRGFGGRFGVGWSFRRGFNYGW